MTKSTRLLPSSRQSVELYLHALRNPLGVLPGSNRPFQFQKRSQLFSRSHDAVIRVYDEAGNVIETHEHKGDFKES